MKTKFTILIMSILISSNLFAQEKGDSTLTDLNSPRSNFKHAIGICPIGLVLGDALVTYEYLLNSTHGLAFMLEYKAEKPAYEDPSYTLEAVSVFLNYRYHFSKEMKSIFIGPHLRGRVFDKEVDASGSLDFNDPEISLGVYLGKRWVWNNGFNIAFTGGYGIHLRESDASSGEFMDNYIGELSVGYAF